MAVLVLAVAPMPFASSAASPEPAETDTAVVIDSHAAAGANGILVRLERTREGFEVVGRCAIDASREDAWRVLTDYDGIDRFVSSMRESRVTGRGDDYLLVEQIAVGRLFVFSRRLRTTLRVHEEPPGRIRFEDVLRRDFVSYRGEWQIQESAGFRTEIVYRVTACPAFSVPEFVARSLFRGTVGELLSEVRAEIERRAALAKR